LIESPTFVDNWIFNVFFIVLPHAS
jgi:hypothetical protein